MVIQTQSNFETPLLLWSAQNFLKIEIEIRGQYFWLEFRLLLVFPTSEELQNRRKPWCLKLVLPSRKDDRLPDLHVLYQTNGIDIQLNPKIHFNIFLFNNPLVPIILSRIIVKYNAYFKFLIYA